MKTGPYYKIFKWNDVLNLWDVKPAGTGGVRIAVDNQARPWIINDMNQIFVHNGNGWLRQHVTKPWIVNTWERSRA